MAHFTDVSFYYAENNIRKEAGNYASRSRNNVLYKGETLAWIRVRVENALSSKDALIAAGLDWEVEQRKIYTEDGYAVHGYFANVRSQDQHTLGVVTKCYKIVQNYEAFAFTDALLGKGIRYETAGSLKGGRKTWILARLPKQYRFTEDKVIPYLVFSNSHDGSAAIKVAMTPVRVVCNNTLNLALQDADRIWSANHTGDIENKLEDATMTLFMAENYMNGLVKGKHQAKP